MKKFTKLTGILTLFVASPSLAQATPESLVSEILADLQTGDAARIMDNLLAKAPLIEVDEELRKKLIDGVAPVLSEYGKVESLKLINEQKISTRLLKRNFIVHQEKYAMRLSLIFYKTSNGWTITGFDIDQKIEELIEN